MALVEPVPPEPYRFVADVDASFEQDDLGRRIEIAERVFHPLTLRTVLPGINPDINPSSFDNADSYAASVYICQPQPEGMFESADMPVVFFIILLVFADFLQQHLVASAQLRIGYLVIQAD